MGAALSPVGMRPHRQTRRFAGLSIREKLLAMVLVPLLGVLPLLGLFLLWWSGEAMDRLLVTKVRSDLAVAHGYFERVLAEVGASASLVAESHALQQALDGPVAERSALLHRFAQRERLDIIRLLGADGRVLASDTGQADESGPPDPAPGTDRTSIEVLMPVQQRVLSPALRQRVAVPLVPTRNAAPTQRTVEDRAMVLLATRSVRGIDGRLQAQVQAGVLLNRNLPFIDHINEIVYPEGSLPFSEWGSRGTATLFLDDVRISTNVRLFGSEGDNRAIGTRVSRTVRESVLDRGTPWLDRAFVVDEWYVSGYLPLADGEGRRVGMLYVGILERPFTLLKYGALASIALLFAAVMTVTAIVSLRRARSIFRPLEQMEATMLQVEAGALEARVGPVASQDEIGRLAGHLDQLLDVIAGNTERLQRWNAELDAKVAERTRSLELAQQQLVRSEKLATVGQLTASIAHEVNNPIAVIQGNLDLVRETLGAAGAAPVAGELALMDEQIERMRLIVTRLLQFARPGEYAGYVENVAPAAALEDSLVLVAHLLARSGIGLRRDLRATRSAAINRHELQQVLVNLLVNAIQAQPEGGLLLLGTADWGGDGVEITVADAGPGLSSELLATLFQPFVTRKKDGTGLGLWISRGIVERYGGEITAARREGGGALFTLRLKVEAAI